MRKAVISLPAKLREPFILYYYFEMNVHEIAETLGIGAENVKSRLFRGRKKNARISDGIVQPPDLVLV